MSDESVASPETELSVLQARCAELEETNRQLVAINESLMDRVEREMNRQGNSFSLFQAATALESKVNERTSALQQALLTLEQTNRELRASNDAAQAASRAKSEFLASMSHELRTPMNGVIGMSELMLRSELNATQRKSIDTIRRSALSLLNILNDILDFSKIEAHQLTPEATAFDLRRVTEQTLGLLQPQIEAKGLELMVDWPTALPTGVIGDPTRFAQILNNLIGNALKFTAEGHIRLSATLLSQQDDSVRYRFEIEDTGIGIQSEVLPRLFNSFTQADSSTTRQFGGSGLGLAIVRSLCELMDGECGVSSELGKGSCFWFSLNLRRAGQTHIATGSFAAFATGAVRSEVAHKHRILVVEDNLINQEVVTAMLETLNCECAVALNGLEAVTALSQPHSFDLVFMDCQMPELDGFEATRRIRSYEHKRQLHTPIVALTANSMVGDRELCLAAGMDDFLGKPFQLHQLAGMLGKWCPQPEAEYGHALANEAPRA
jgi:two-component system, sensor histidine kinase